MGFNSGFKGLNTSKFIGTSSETDAGLSKIYWRIGSRFSAAHIEIAGLKFVDILRVRLCCYFYDSIVLKSDSA